MATKKLKAKTLRIYVWGEGIFKALYRDVPEADQVVSLSDDNILDIVKAGVKAGVHEFCLIGEEPLKRPGIVELIKAIKAVEGVEKLSMETSGVLLVMHAGKLKEAGLDAITVTLDSLKYSAYSQLIDGGVLDDVVPGINASIDAGITDVTIKVHIFEGINDSELMDFLQLTFQHKYKIVFYEVPGGKYGNFVSMKADAIKAKMPALRSMMAEGTELPFGEIEYFKYPVGVGKMGFVSPVSDPEHALWGQAEIDYKARLKATPYSEPVAELKDVLKDTDKLTEAITEAIE